MKDKTDKKLTGGCDECGNKSDKSQYKWHWDNKSESWIVVCDKCYPNYFRIRKGEICLAAVSQKNNVRRG